MRRLFDGLDLWEVPPLADDFALARGVPSGSRTVQPQRSSWLPWLAVAAVLLLSLLPGYWLLRRSTAPVATTLVAARQSTRQRWPTPALRPQTAATEWSRTDSLWTLYGNSLLELYPEATRERHRQQVSEFAEDLRPIATPFNAAVTAIRRTIPVGRSPEKGPALASIPRCRRPHARLHDRPSTWLVLHPPMRPTICAGHSLPAKQQKTPP